MHIVIDILAAMILLLFLLAGWHKGFLLSVLSVARVVLAYGLSYFAGRYLGAWLGEALHRPRIVMVPVIAGLTFILITLVFYLTMNTIRDRHRRQAELGNASILTISRLGGSIINLGTGILSLIFLLWITEFLVAGITGYSMPDAKLSRFVRFSRGAIYTAANIAFHSEGHEVQIEAAARAISHPADSIDRLEKIILSDSVQNLITDPDFAEALLSGNPDRIAQTPSLQRLFNDRKTLTELRDIGVLSEHETKPALCSKLARVGGNQNIQVAITRLENKGLLDPDKISYLIRDPDFDIIVGELLK